MHIDAPFIDCPECEATGWLTQGTMCPRCDGYGRIYFIERTPLERFRDWWFAKDYRIRLACVFGFVLLTGGCAAMLCMWFAKAMGWG